MARENLAKRVLLASTVLITFGDHYCLLASKVVYQFEHA
jgi:hypothetical protein